MKNTKKKQDKTELMLCGYDLHYPLVNWPSFNVMMDFISRNKVDYFLFGGDQFNNDSISHHTKGKPLLRIPGSFREDEEGFKKEILAPLEKLLGSTTKRIWIEGNHDNWVQQLVEQQPEFDGMQREKSLPLQNWQVISMGQSFRKGHCTFIHGEQLSGIGNQASVMHSRKAVENFCNNVVYGHMHSPQSFTKVLPFDNTQKWQAWCSPILGDVNPAYLHNRPTAWLNGFTIVEYHKDGMFNVYPVIVTNGRCVFAGKVYKDA